ncbi:protein NRT1/ PTR FAMILY 5.10-like isoform X2 [Papaver somniferum]|uniref:protein NRT1/ PTR FAMILY 5.10-like isoform X2 n=1 Tax=Papaver somniferum TaxID=3469 RepID=UPI000E6FE0B6|nr:protein NRT1/ PTR FAMILY 5.10-like isoform X2 [Papaver somniferum]
MVPLFTSLFVDSVLGRFRTILFSCLIYIMDNMSWAIAFGISCIVMMVALTVFLLRMHTFRFNVKQNNTDAILDIIQVFVVAEKNWRSKPSIDHEQAVGTAYHTPSGSHQFKFLDKALIGFSKNLIPCSISQVEDAKVLLQLVPIWITCLIYVVVSSQTTTFFTRQSITLDRSIGPNFQIPAASIYIFTTLSVVFFGPIYDCLFIPLVRVVTGNPNGITTLQRIGCGIFFSTTSMVVAAVIEKKRLQAALNFGLIDNPNATIPMSVLWLVPQYALSGFESVFTLIGLQEFFYDQSPKGLTSLGLSLFTACTA